MVTGVVAGVVFGVAIGMAVGVAVGVAGGVAVGVAFIMVFGMVFGGVVFGVAVGVAVGAVGTIAARKSIFAPPGNWAVRSWASWGVVGAVSWCRVSAASYVAGGLRVGVVVGVAVGVAVGVRTRKWKSALRVRRGGRCGVRCGVRRLASEVAAAWRSGYWRQASSHCLLRSPNEFGGTWAGCRRWHIGQWLALGSACCRVRQTPPLMSGSRWAACWGSAWGWLRLFGVRCCSTHWSAAWNTLLYRADQRRADCRPSLLRWHSAFWDEFQRLRLYGLDEHLVLVAERDPTEAARAMAYLATGRQRWAAQAAQVELDARRLEQL